MASMTSAKDDLAKALSHRPDRDELIGRNILPSMLISLLYSSLMGYIIHRMSSCL
ncbi:hypothetical protein M408DRAFT_330361 [Serendipita vermifera MAFF 305830]|uniref:Uncharacterized protein n=1 Tax=Serendipita vermifera MAFF 305830 TaxID=933852 RepID=A0A0C2XD47_SERVB|nr:hypothetical protein M408DRAFT_330361 [Serendipita vermifera MAFF 305830]